MVVAQAVFPGDQGLPTKFELYPALTFFAAIARTGYLGQYPCIVMCLEQAGHEVGLVSGKGLRCGFQTHVHAEIVGNHPAVFVPPRLLGGLLRQTSQPAARSFSIP